MENIGAKDLYIKDLQGSIARKDSLNMALVMNLKGAIGNLDDKDINIKVEKGVVYVDISDKLLFKSGSYDVNERAKEVLGKVAKVLKAQPDIEFQVEGHTDTVPIKGGALVDNWDLSVKRATTIVRLLQDTYGLDPKRMTAAGRSEYIPVADNGTAEGRAANRKNPGSLFFLSWISFSNYWSGSNNILYKNTSFEKAGISRLFLFIPLIDSIFFTLCI